MRMTAGLAAALVALGFVAGVAATHARAPGEIKRAVLLTKSLAPKVITASWGGARCRLGWPDRRIFITATNW